MVVAAHIFYNFLHNVTLMPWQCGSLALKGMKHKINPVVMSERLE